MEDLVEAALANAAAEDRGDGETGGAAVEVSEFGPIRVAVVGVGGRGRARLDRLAAATADWDRRTVRLAFGVAPVEAPASAPLRAHPEGASVPDLEAVDLVLTTGHVHAGADVERLRGVVDRTPGDAVTVALPTVDQGTRETSESVAATLESRFDAVVPVAAGRAATAPVERPPGPGDVDVIDGVATAVAVALLEPLPVGGHRPVTPHQPLLPLVDAAGPGVAHVGTAGADAAPTAPIEDALARLLAAGGGADGGVVAHLATGPDLTLSEADAVRAALSDAVATDDAVPQYVGAAPDREDGADRRAVVITFEGG